MNPRVACAALALVALGCRHRPRRPRHRAPTAAVTNAVLVAPADGAAIALGRNRFVVGALRVEGALRAGAPYPASPLAACAETADGWRFAAQDGTLYAAPTFTGPLRVIGVLPAALAAPTSARFALGAGALVAVDVNHRARWVDADGGVREVPAAHALAALALDARTGLVVDGARGVVFVRDGGRTIEPVAPAPAGIALSVAMVNGRVVLRTTAGRFAWRDGAFARDPDAPDPASARDGDAEIERALPPHERAPLPLPREPERAVARTDGMIDVLRGDEVLRYDPRTLRVLRRAEAPGSACALYRARLGTRAVCTHEGWARAVFAEERGWAAIRDELHAEPMGALAFDDVTPAWAVGAPCTQRPTADASAACVYRADGQRAEVALPFDGAPVAMHAGAVLFAEALRDASTTAAALWRDGALTAVQLPVPPAAARAARWEGDALTMVDGVTLLRARIDRAGRVTVTRADAPVGARAIVRGDGVAFAVGREGAWRLQGDRFVSTPIALQGSAIALDLAAGDGWCAGPWCRLSDALWWSGAGARGAAALSHASANALPVDEESARGPWRCEVTEAGAGVDIDRGVAVDGRSMEVTRGPSGLAFLWHGAEGASRGAVPGIAAGPLLAMGVPGEGPPAGMVVDRAFQRVVAVPGHVVALPDRVEGHTDLTRVSDARLVARTLTERDGALEVDLFSLDAATGAVVARRRLVLGAAMADVSPGAMAGAPGLWMRAGAALTFIPAEGEGAWQTVPISLERNVICADGAAGTGAVHVRTHVRGLRGDTWMADWREWTLDEVLRVGPGGSCVASIAGGEARDEREMERAAEREGRKVRALRLRAEGGALRGTAWAGERLLEISCTPR